MDDAELRKLRALQFASRGSGSSRMASIKSVPKKPITIQYEEDALASSPSEPSSSSSSSSSSEEPKKVEETPVAKKVEPSQEPVEPPKASPPSSPGKEEGKEDEKEEKHKKKKEGDEPDKMDLMEVLSKLSEQPEETLGEKVSTSLPVTLLCLLMGVVVAFLHAHPVIATHVSLSALLFNLLPLCMIFMIIASWRNLWETLQIIIDPETKQISFSITNVFPFLSGIKQTFSTISCRTSLIAFSFVISLPVFSLLLSPV